MTLKFQELDDVEEKVRVARYSKIDDMKATKTLKSEKYDAEGKITILMVQLLVIYLYFVASCCKSLQTLCHKNFLPTKNNILPRKSIST